MIAADDPTEKEEIRDQLLDYCERDTYTMVGIHRSLSELVH